MECVQCFEDVILLRQHVLVYSFITSLNVFAQFRSLSVLNVPLFIVEQSRLQRHCFDEFPMDRTFSAIIL